MPALPLVSLVPPRTLVLRAAARAAAGLGVVAAAAWVATHPPSRLGLGVALFASVCQVPLLRSAWRTVRELLHRRPMWTTLSLLTCPLPAGWRGPYVLDAREGGVVWAIDHEDEADGGRRWTEVVALRRRKAADSEELLLAFVRNQNGPLPPARARALLQQLLAVRWLHVEKEEPAASAFACFPHRPRRPLELEDATRCSAVPECPLFGSAIELPAAVTFPREPFAAELARHEALVREQLGALAFLARQPSGDILGPYDCVHGFVGEIDARGNGAPGLHVIHRAVAAHVFADILGVRHRLQIKPEPGLLEIIVRTDDLVSMHVARVEETARGKKAVTRSLVLEAAAVVFEPTRQEHARVAERIAIRWQAAAGGEVHEAVTTAPAPARSPVEATDRLFALRADRIRRAVWGGGRGEPLSEGFLWYSYTRTGGESALRVDYRRGDVLGVLQAFPDIRRALGAHRAYGDWYPVVVDSVRHAGLRWLPMRAGLGESTRPDTVDEVNRKAQLHAVEA